MPDQDPIDRRIRHAAHRSIQSNVAGSQQQHYQRELLGLHLTKGMFLRPFAVNFTKLPEEVDLTPPAALAKLFFFLALFFLFMTGLPFLIILGQPDSPIWVIGLMAIGPIIALSIALICWKKMRRKRWARFDETSVSVKQRGFPGLEDWSENYSAFAGLKMEVRTVNTRYAKRDFFLVTLEHSDPNKSVPTMIERDEQEAIESLGLYSEYLKLPILDKNQSP